MKLSKAANIRKEDFEQLLSQIHATLAPSPDQPGRFAIDMPKYDSLFPLLAEVTRFPDSVHRSEVTGAISKAVMLTREAENSSLEFFFTTLRDCLDTYVALPPKPFTMWTKIHVSNARSATSYMRFCIDGVTLLLRARLPKPLQLESHFLNGFGTIDPDGPAGGAYLIARGEAKTEHQAGASLSQAIEDLVVLLNFPFLAWSHQWRSGRDRPKSVILVGPFQYLFGPGLRRNEDRVWYTPDFNEDDWRLARKSYDDVKRAAPWVRRFLSKTQNHSCKKQIWRALRLLGDGWASSRPTYRLLRSWTALEALFSENPEKADSYDVIVRRASFMSTQPELRRWKLRHAALVRNRYVHENREAIALDNIISDLDRYICGIISWLVFQETAIESHNRLLNFVDQPLSLQRLEERKQDAEKAIEMLERAAEG